MIVKIVVILGTRPEIIKCAPVILEAKRLGHAVTVVSTGQHREMLKALFGFFGIRPDLDLDVMTPGQSLTSLSARILEKLDENADRLAADWVLVQGDTTTAMIAGYWAFCQKHRIAHLEAGLRTNDLAAPFPEEGNRQIIGRLATLHLAPTSEAVQALRKEAVPASRIRRVGSTSIDAFLYTLACLAERRVPPAWRLPAAVASFADGHPLALITAHRRENFGAPLERICEGILGAVRANPGLKAVFPVHPNPQVRQIVSNRLGGVERILLCDPLPYVAFVELMRLSDLLLTDSGGVQEEAPTLRIPLIVLREKTERPEGVRAGFSRLVGTDPLRIQVAVRRALERGCEGKGRNPYGDGKTSQRVLRALGQA